MKEVLIPNDFVCLKFEGQDFSCCISSSLLITAIKEYTNKIPDILKHTTIPKDAQ